MGYDISPIKALQDGMNSVRQRLQSASPISSEIRDELFLQLDSLSLEGLKKQADSVTTLFSSYLDDYMSLWGEVDKRFTDSEIARIKFLTQQLKQDLPSGNLHAVAKDVDALKKNISTLTKNYRLLTQDLRVIREARESLKVADAYLAKTMIGTTINQPNLLRLLQEAALEELEGEEEEEPEVMELFSTAYLFYQHKLKDGMRQFNQLSESQKGRYRKHVETLGGDPFDPTDDTTIAIQALIATAREVCHADDGEPYLEEDEIETMFREVSDLNRQMVQIQGVFGQVNPQGPAGFGHNVKTAANYDQFPFAGG